MEDGQTGVDGVLVQWHVRVRLITSIEQGRVRVLPSTVAVIIAQIMVNLTPVIPLVILCVVLVRIRYLIFTLYIVTIYKKCIYKKNTLNKKNMYKQPLSTFGFRHNLFSGCIEHKPVQLKRQFSCPMRHYERRCSTGTSVRSRRAKKGPINLGRALAIDVLFWLFHIFGGYFQLFLVYLENNYVK